VSIVTRRRALVGLAAGLSLVVTACASTPTASLVTVTATVPAAPIASTTTTRLEPRRPAKPQRFAGVGTENLGTITVPVDSTLQWSCPSCSSDNYQIVNSDAGSNIAVNGLDQTSGTTVITAGIYHSVTINTEGQNWAFTITPGNSTQTPAAPPVVPTQTSQATPVAPTPSQPTANLSMCDANISVGPNTTCPFAENTFYEYYAATGGNASEQATVQAWSSVTQQYYTEGCSSGAGVVDCAGGTGSEVHFSQGAIAAYTPSEASSYAASGHLGPNG
jgi:hypothetical protein